MPRAVAARTIRAGMVGLCGVVELDHEPQAACDRTEALGMRFLRECDLGLDVH